MSTRFLMNIQLSQYCKLVEYPGVPHKAHRDNNLLAWLSWKSAVNVHFKKVVAYIDRTFSNPILSLFVCTASIKVTQLSINRYEFVVKVTLAGTYAFMFHIFRHLPISTFQQRTFSNPVFFCIQNSSKPYFQSNEKMTNYVSGRLS